jgi:S1-C subfamily serine protease
VQDASPAARAGIRRGDLIVAAAGTPLESVDSLYEALDAITSGATLDLTLWRGSEQADVMVSFDEAEPEVGT